MTQPILEARHLGARYAGAARLAVDDVSFAISAGELLAVTGPNGSGKTTLLRALLGLVPLQAGEALVQGRPVRAWARADLATVVGVVPQREEIVFPIRVRDMVMLGRYARLGRTANASARDHKAVDEALARCDATQLGNRPVDELSGGEWQRVRIARAVAQEPRLLVLDEPTVSLDVRHEMELFELVRQLVNDGLAGIVITHELNLAARYADRMLLLDAGCIVRSGSPAHVLDRETLAQVFGWPVAVTRWCDGSPQVVPLRPSEFPDAPRDNALPPMKEWPPA
ncbi:MAG: ABC transporter ATP-binding protein [Gemmatimonadota bacterium]